MTLTLSSYAPFSGIEERLCAAGCMPAPHSLKNLVHAWDDPYTSLRHYVHLYVMGNRVQDYKTVGHRKITSRICFFYL